MFTSYARQNDSTYLLISQKLFKVQLQMTNDLDTSKTVQTPSPPLFLVLTFHILALPLFSWCSRLLRIGMNLIQSLLFQGTE